MTAREQQRFERLQRVLTFLHDHPLIPPVSYGRARQILLEAVIAIYEYLKTQRQSSRFGKSYTVFKNGLRKELQQEHLRPIAVIAQAALRQRLSLDRAVLMPGTTLATTKLLAAVAAFRDVAVKHADTLIEHGRPADFIARLDAMVDALNKAMLFQARSQGEMSGATEALPQALRKGGDAVKVLDAKVREVFKGNAAVLGKWESAKKVHLPKGRRRARKTK